MKKNLYYRTVMRRRNAIKEFIFGFFLKICSYPRLLLEVFIKRNFGERYFSFSSAVILALIMLFIPLPVIHYVRMLAYASDYNVGVHFITWYVFTVAFLFVAVRRRDEIKRLPSVFDFSRFSLFQGDLIPAVRSFMISRGNLNVRLRETLIEPCLFFVIGIVLIILAQPIGWIIFLASICYSISYMAAYHNGDNFVMDKIDEMILNEEMETAFIGDEDAANSRGVRFYAKKPTSQEMRRKVADSFIDDDDDVSEAI